MMPLQTQIKHSVLAAKNQVLTVEYLSEKYNQSEKKIIELAQENKDLTVSNGVVMAKREKAFVAACAGAGAVTLLAVLILPGLIG